MHEAVHDLDRPNPISAVVTHTLRKYIHRIRHDLDNLDPDLCHHDSHRRHHVPVCVGTTGDGRT